MIIWRIIHSDESETLVYAKDYEEMVFCLKEQGFIVSAKIRYYHPQTLDVAVPIYASHIADYKG